MAGIGFELNKLVNKKNFLSKVSGYFYTTSSCLGSMILGFVLLFVIQFIAKSLGQDTLITEKFTSYTTNTVFLSMIIFSVFSLILSRYISDLIYTKNEERILPSFWGVITIMIPISLIIYIPILMISKIDAIDITLLLILLAEFVSTWVITLYITILKQYKKITLAFGLSILVSVALLIICYQIKIINMEIMLGTIIISYGIVLMLLISILQKKLNGNSTYTYEFLNWFSKYPILAFTGLFSTMSALIHFYIMWFSNNGKEVQGLIHSAPTYDLPAIMAYFSTIITSVTFIAVLEPNFYKKYSNYFKLLNASGNYEQLHMAKREMVATLKVELRNLILKQIVCTLFFVIIISQILSNLNIGMTKSMIESFKILCIGYSLYAIGTVMLQLQLYFSDNKGAFISSLVLFVCTAIGTFLTLFLDQTFYGVGITIGSAIMAVVADKRLENYLNNLEYNVLNKKESTKSSKIYEKTKQVKNKMEKIFKNKKISTVLNICTIAILVGILSLSFYKEGSLTTKKFTPKQTDVVLNNPGVGFAPWADSETTLNSKTSLVYIDLSWKEWEPKEGQYDYQNFEKKNFIDEYKKQGRQAVFRFYMDYPSEESHMDIPDWLYQKINKEGTWYNTTYGKGFSPNYNNEVLISYHKKAIEAFAQKYANEDFFLYIELGSLGHWGEWHVNHEEGVEKLPDYETRKRYIAPYTDNIKNSKFLMRYSVAESKDFNCGLYNDMTGDIEDTEYWFEGMKGEEVWEQSGKNELVNNVDTWKNLPIGGEFASSYSNEYFISNHLDITLLLLKKSHQSFIGPKIIFDENNSKSYSKQKEEILKALGHRLYVKKAIIEKENKDILNVSLDMGNSGNAPIYTDVNLALYLCDESGKIINKVVDSDFDLKSILPDTVKTTSLNINTDLLVEKQKYNLCIGLVNENDGEPGIEMAMEKYRDMENIYKIGEFNW